MALSCPSPIGPRRVRAEDDIPCNEAHRHMTRQRPFRLAVVNAISLMLVVGLFAGPAAAKAPTANLSDTWEASPGVVSAGALVRFDVHITNDSSSNYSSFFVDAATPNGATLVAWFGESQGSCDGSSGDLSCDFGALNSGATVDFATIYEVPSSASGSFSVTFIATSNGSTGSDKPGQSHGDDYVVVTSVDIGSGSTAGSYIYGDVLSTQNNQNLNKNNPQSSKLVFHDDKGTGFPATVQQEAGGFYTCPTDTAASCFGGWSVISADEGATFADGFTVILGYDKIAGQAADVQFVHLLTTPLPADPELNVDYEIIQSFNDNPCQPGGASYLNMPCVVSIETIQGDTYFTLALTNNGPLRGW